MIWVCWLLQYQSLELFTTIFSTLSLWELNKNYSPFIFFIFLCDLFLNSIQLDTCFQSKLMLIQSCSLDLGTSNSVLPLEKNVAHSWENILTILKPLGFIKIQLEEKRCICQSVSHLPYVTMLNFCVRCVVLSCDIRKYFHMPISIWVSTFVYTNCKM